MNILPEVDRENVRHGDLFIQVHGVNSAKITSIDPASKFNLYNKYWDVNLWTWVFVTVNGGTIEFQLNKNSRR